MLSQHRGLYQCYKNPPSFSLGGKVGGRGARISPRFRNIPMTQAPGHSGWTFLPWSWQTSRHGWSVSVPARTPRNTPLACSKSGFQPVGSSWPLAASNDPDSLLQEWEEATEWMRSPAILTLRKWYSIFNWSHPLIGIQWVMLHCITVRYLDPICSSFISTMFSEPVLRQSHTARQRQTHSKEYSLPFLGPSWQIL